MEASTSPHPRIVSQDQWVAERKKLLPYEKELTKHRDRVNAERRRLPMVKIEKDYGASRGFPRLAAISITTFTSRSTQMSRPSNTTIGARTRWWPGTAPISCRVRSTA